MLLSGYLLGLQVAIPFGPINMEIVRRGLRDRPLSGMCVGFGAVTIDFLYMNVAGMGLARLLANRAVGLVIYALGGLFLCLLTRNAFVEAWRWWHADPGDWGLGEARGGHADLLRSYLTGLGMTALSPFTILFWASVPSTTIFRGLMTPPTVQQVLVASAGVFLGCLTWVCFLGTILSIARRWVGPRFFAAASALGGCMIGWMALKFGYQVAVVILAGFGFIGRF